MSLTKIRKETAQRMGTEASSELLSPCSECSEFTSLASLSMHGNRCYRCYQAYCRRPWNYPAEEDRSPLAQTWRRMIEAAGKPLPR